MRIYGLVGDWFDVEYTVDGSFDMRSAQFQVADDHNLEDKLKALCATRSRCSASQINIFQVFRVMK